MFDQVELNLAGQWYTPTLGEIAELLVFYDRVHLIAPLGRLGGLVPWELDDLRLLRELVERNRIHVTIDQLPLGEVAWEMGLFQNPFGDRADPSEARDRMQEAYPQVKTPPSKGMVTIDSVQGRARAAAWQEEWEKIAARSWDRLRTESNYLDAVIANARRKLSLITEPGFLDEAFKSYGGESASTLAMLANIKPIDLEFEGQAVRGFESPQMGASAALYEFLSQADWMIDTIDCHPEHDSYTSADYDRWTQDLVATSLRRAGAREDVNSLQTAILGSSSVAKAIDSGRRRFVEIEPLLEAREPFAKAVRNRKADQSLAEAYFEELNHTSWITHGPGRILRFSAFTGVAVVAGLTLTPLTGAAVGASLNSFDYFVLDRILKSNACRKFVEGPLQTFVGAPQP